MAQTTTQKLQKRLKREGRFDYTQMRGGTDIAISTLTQRTKSKKQCVEAKERKHKQRLYE